jgi:hypothetical protein
MERKLHYVPPVNLRMHWPMVRAALDDMLDRHPDNWIPEDVYHAIKSGRAHLHMSGLGGYVSGFVVLEPIEDFDGMKLHMWIGWSKEGDAMQAHMPELIEYAKNINAKRIVFSSYRKGWELFAAKRGFSKEHTNYQMEVC